jgi:hypothetical protein
MRKRQDVDAELKAFADRTRQLKELRIRLLGELVVATGADALTDAELTGALIVIAETTDAAKQEAWAKRGEAYFRNRSRTRTRHDNNGARDPANDDSRKSHTDKAGAA